MEQHGKADGENGIIIRDRRKPNQYTTDNVIAREWLPILRVGDAFFFYSVYLSMANRETESSWASLRTLAQYLQCGVDLIIRGNKLLEICELIHIEPGNQYTANEYYILDPPSLTPELAARISARLDEIEAQETGKNWQAWVKQVRSALQNHVSLPQIWAQRRAHRGGRPLKTARPEKGDCGPQPGFSENGACEPQPPCACPTSRVVVPHEQGDCETQPEQEKLTSKTNKVDQDAASLQNVLSRCRALGVAPTVLDVLLEKYPLALLDKQLTWLPARHPRDPAAMFVRAVQENWDEPPQFDLQQSAQVWVQWLADTSSEMSAGLSADRSEHQSGDVLWQQVLQELEMQMTRATFDQWLRGTRVVRAEPGRLVVEVRDGYALEWINRRLAQRIVRTVQDVAGHPVDVCFVVRSEPETV